LTTSWQYISYGTTTDFSRSIAVWRSAAQAARSVSPTAASQQERYRQWEKEEDMEEEEVHGIVIVGGGICGLATALALHRWVRQHPLTT
jgi:NADH dehydrogenase FAD-containing subunit